MVRPCQDRSPGTGPARRRSPNRGRGALGLRAPALAGHPSCDESKRTRGPGRGGPAQPEAEAWGSPRRGAPCPRPAVPHPRVRGAARCRRGLLGSGYLQPGSGPIPVPPWQPYGWKIPAATLEEGRFSFRTQGSPLPKACPDLTSPPGSPARQAFFSALPLYFAFPARKVLQRCFIRVHVCVRASHLSVSSRRPSAIDGCVPEPGLAAADGQ